MNTEQVYAALFDLVSNVADFKTTSRRLRHWSEVAPSDQPALFMTQPGATLRSDRTRIPGIWILRAQFIVYANTDGGYISVPATVLNPILDAIVSAVQPVEPLPEQTLGGLVERCRIDGEIETDEGVLGDQGLLIIPVSILVPQ